MTLELIEKELEDMFSLETRTMDGSRTYFEQINPEHYIDELKTLIRKAYQSGIALGREEGRRAKIGDMKENNWAKYVTEIRSQIIQDAIEVIDKHIASSAGEAIPSALENIKMELEELILKS